MKALQTFAILILSVLIVACGNSSDAEQSTTATSTEQTATETQQTTSTEATPSTEKTPEKRNTSTKQTETSPPAKLDYNLLSDAYCKCSENTVSINNDLAKLMDAGDNAAFEAMLPKAEKAFKEAMDCCKKAKESQSSDKVDQQKLFKPLKKICPDLPKQLMLKMVTEIK